MRIIKNEELENLTNFDIIAITSTGADFKLALPNNAARHFKLFAEADSAVRHENRGILNRLRHVRGLWHGFFVLNTLQLWNLAYIDGYRIKDTVFSHSDCVIEFSKT